MTEKNWLWAAVIAGGIILGVVWSKQKEGRFTPAGPNDGWVPSQSQQPQPVPPPVQPVPPGKTQPPPGLPATTYDGLLRQAREQNKQMVLFFTSRSCPPCERMKKDVLPNTSVQQALGNYLYYVVNYETEPAMFQKFSVQATPTIMMIDGTERMVKQNTGYMAADQLVNWLGGSARPPAQQPTQPQQQRQPLRRPGC